jgi:hypothetical protein
MGLVRGSQAMRTTDHNPKDRIMTDAQLLITRHRQGYHAAHVIVDKGYAGWRGLPNGVDGRNLTSKRRYRCEGESELVAGR